MKSFQKFLPRYSIALVVLFSATVLFLLTRANTVDVEVGEVSPSDLVQAIYATGFVEADTVAELHTEASGRVIAVGALEGEQVRAGQTIVQLDATRAELAVREARAALAEQQAIVNDNRLRFARRQALFREGAISRQELEESERSRLQSEELLQQRQLQIGMKAEEARKSSIVAPFSGTLTLQSLKVGDYAPANTLVAQVVDSNGFMVVVEVDELDMPRLRVGQAATVAFDALPDKRYKAMVSRLVPHTDRITKTSRLYLTLQELPASIQEGMTATANIVYNVRPQALLVRKNALVDEQRKSYVWKIEKGALKKVEVEQGASDISFVEVLRGVRAGDKLVLSPAKTLRDGMEAKITSIKKL